MAKENAKDTKTVVEQPETDVQPVQEQPNDAEAANLDTGSEEKTTPPEGAGTDNQVNDPEAEASFEEAKEVLKSMVGEAVEGLLDEPKETTEKRNKIAADVFAKNPQCKDLHFTADMIPFYVKSDAIRHGVTLKDDTIVTVNRK